MNPTSGQLRSTSRQPGPSQVDGVMDQVTEATQAVGAFASEAVAAMKERPYTTIAVASGLAFAIGALWMVRRHQPQSTYEAMRSRLPALPDRQSLWPARWR